MRNNSTTAVDLNQPRRQQQQQYQQPLYHSSSYFNQQQNDNDRYFDSTTLYKNELKLKQKNYLYTTTIPSNTIVTSRSTPLNLSASTSTLSSSTSTSSSSSFKAFKQPSLPPSTFIQPQNSLHRVYSPNEVDSVPVKIELENVDKLNRNQPNKVLNIINNLIKVGHKKATTNPTISTGLNRLKRASSSTQFPNKTKLKFTSSLSNTSTTASSSSIKLEPKLSTTSNIETDAKRLSLDDKFIDKYENTLYSSKNSGLIFVPSSQPAANPQQPHDQPNDDDRIYEKLAVNKISTGFISTSTENFLNGSSGDEMKTSSIANLNLNLKKRKFEDS
jgi:hypothetical protein